MRKVVLEKDFGKRGREEGRGDKGRVQLKKKILNFADLVGGWVWKNAFSRFKKNKKICSKNA